MTASSDVLTRVTTPNGELQLTRMANPLLAYDADIQTSVMVYYLNGTDRRQVRGLPELASITATVTPVESTAYGLAQIVAALAVDGRVVRDTPLYAFIGDSFNVELSQEAPRFDGQILRFLVVASPEVGEVDAFRCTFNLRTGELTRSRVDRRPQPST